MTDDNFHVRDGEQEDYEDALLDLAEAPSLIATREQAAEVIAVLERKIAAIQAQLDGALVEAAGQPLSPNRSAWVRRASFAKSMMANTLRRVGQREKALRREKGNVPPDPMKAETKRLKQERLMAEAETRRVAKQESAEKLRTEQMRLSEQRREREAGQRWEHRFVEIARARLPAGKFSELKRATDTAQGIVTRSAETSEAQAPGASDSERVEPGPTNGRDAPYPNDPSTSAHHFGRREFHKRKKAASPREGRAAKFRTAGAISAKDRKMQ